VSEKNFNSTMLAAAIFCVGLAFSTGAMAETYQYVGADFSLYGGAYTQLDSVSGTFTVANAFAANVPFGPYGDLSVTAFSFTDGVQTLSDANANAYIDVEQTDAAGLPSRWDIQINSLSYASDAAGSGTINSYNDHEDGGFPLDIAWIYLGAGETNEEGAFSQVAGTWSDVTPAATPLPASLPLFAGGLGFVGYLSRRKVL
jgi:hypothetical protein